MKRLAAFIVVLALLGCEEHEGSQHAAAQPEPVAPVEVTAPGQAAVQPADEVTQLRARVAELEQQLAACQGPAAQPGATRTAPVPAVVPQGVDVPGQPASTTPATTTPTTSPTATAPTANHPDAGTRQRRQRDPSLLEEILGDNAPRERRQGDRRVIELPEPSQLPDPTGLLR